ncbi:polyketide cyclase/dehydrase/lipid transport protein [Actinomycetospora succinea]|uniref:Polyketide cyclase/dehydrase/lipid transport protein n=1 Tax=Actinomycetospora succinea TaxID=663603 RepID=A0A4R6VHQ1_9PSEU|nr:SRPBCC family protein [Actinomycetospora succinea]TDQ61000.1 polyketide cyclase/dehydrase/lipid transport protein [Actinomycetospora succinea]
MPEVTTSAVIPADADTVWRVIRDFDGLPDWHPAIAASELEGGEHTDRVGAVRRLTLGDGGVVRESLVTLDDRERLLTYAILESPFPVRDYRSTIRVLPVTTTGESFVSWSVLFDCDLDDAERLSALFGRDVFGSGLEGLASHLSSSA